MKTNEIEIHKIEMANPETFKKHPDNYRGHPQDQIDHIVESLRRIGMYKNVVISKDDYLLAGHGVREACRLVGLDKIPVVRLKHKHNEPEALLVLTADNEIGRLAEVFDRKLTENLKRIKEAFDSLEGTGLDEKMLANLVYVTRDADEIKDIDAAAEWTGMPDYDFDDKEAEDALFSIVVSFETEEDRENFLKKYPIKIAMRIGKKWSTTWPYQERRDMKSIKVESE